MNPKEDNTQKPDLDTSVEPDEHVEKYFPARAEDRKRVAEGPMADFPEWSKRAFLLPSRVERAVLDAQKLREAFEEICQRIREELASNGSAIGTSDELATLDGAKCYQRFGVETRLESVLLAFDTEAMRIEQLVGEVCYVPQVLAGQPLSPLLARFLDYRNEYRLYLETAITKGRRDRVREQGLHQQWIGHMKLVGMTANELGERLDMAEKSRQRKEGVDQQNRQRQPDTGMKDRFTFNPGQALFDGKDLVLPSGEPIPMLKKLVERFGHVVPYTDFDRHYSSAMPGTVHKSKHKIVDSFKRQCVPCEITSKTGEGYLITERMPAAHRKKRVRRK